MEYDNPEEVPENELGIALDEAIDERIFAEFAEERSQAIYLFADSAIDHGNGLTEEDIEDLTTIHKLGLKLHERFSERRKRLAKYQKVVAQRNREVTEERWESELGDGE